MVILSLKVVLRAGLEPTTLCLEGRCSIQLSYRSKPKQRITADNQPRPCDMSNMGAYAGYNIP